MILACKARPEYPALSVAWHGAFPASTYAREAQASVGQVQVRGVVVAQPGGMLVTPGVLAVRRPVAERVG